MADHLPGSMGHKIAVGQSLAWTEDMDKAFWGCLEEYHDKGKRSDTGWKPEVWKDCTLRVQDNFTGSYIIPEKKVRNHIDVFKKQWKDRLFLLDCSGFGWDADIEKVTASEDVWERIIESHPKLKWYRTHRVRFVEVMEKCFSGRQAVGKGAIGINSLETSSQGAHSSSLLSKIDPAILQNDPIPIIAKTTIPDDNGESSTSRKRAASRILGPTLLQKRDRGSKTSKSMDDLALNLQLNRELKARIHEDNMLLRNSIEVQALRWMEVHCAVAFQAIDASKGHDLLQDLYSPTPALHRSISQGEMLMSYSAEGSMRQALITTMFHTLGVQTKWKKGFVIEARLETMETIAEEDRLDAAKAVAEREAHARIAEEEIAFAKDSPSEDENTAASDTEVYVDAEGTDTIIIS